MKFLCLCIVLLCEIDAALVLAVIAMRLVYALARKVQDRGMTQLASWSDESNGVDELERIFRLEAKR